MSTLNIAFVSFATGVFAAATLRPEASPSSAAPGFCTMMPGKTLALMRVEKDTTLPFGSVPFQVTSLSRLPGSDSLLATATTLMPAARVRLLQLDSTTRSILTTNGITDRQPSAFLRAAPYRYDCRTIRWTDTTPFVRRGEEGYVRATLAPREQWIGNVPVIVIGDVWNYPYPHRRGLAYGVDGLTRLAPAEAMFNFNNELQTRTANDSERRTGAMAWARANPQPAEMEPLRTLIRREVLSPDMTNARRIPSRLRGTYRVNVETSGEKTSWYFRTQDKPGFPWARADSLRTTAELITSPFIAGYQLVGYGARSRDSLLNTSPRGRDMADAALVWLASDDRPTAPDNNARRVLVGALSFQLSAAPEQSRDILELLVPRLSTRDSAMMARMNLTTTRDKKQPRIPLTLRLDTSGGVRGDTSIVVGGHTLRVVLERIDTLNLPFATRVPR